MFLRPWNFPGKNTGVGCHFLLRGIFLKGIKPLSLVSPALAGGFFTTHTTWEAIIIYKFVLRVQERRKKIRTDVSNPRFCLLLHLWLSKCVGHLVVSDSLWPHGLQPTRLLCPWDFPGKNTGVSWHAFLQGLFPTQRLNLGLLGALEYVKHI